MLWVYKFKSKVDAGDADWINREGEIGTFDDEDRDDMAKLFMHLILLQKIAELYDDGTFDQKKALDEFKSSCATTNITEEDWTKFIKDEDLEDELFSYSDWFIPQCPDICCRPHSLSFTFHRVLVQDGVETVSVSDVDKYVTARA